VSSALIDREKHDIDILEHVVKGVQAEEIKRASDPHPPPLNSRGSLGGHVLAAVQVPLTDTDDEEG
jgi:hypothetical protein